MAAAEFDTCIAVTGAHLTPEFGMTVREIEADGLPIDKKIEIVLGSDTPVALSKSMGLAMISFGEYFAENPPEALVVLGDRYETLAVCCIALNARIPIFHIHGGETTEGVIDEAIRHSITKMSYLHFTCTETYRRHVIQMGEQPDRGFNVGAMGVENALGVEKMSVAELEASLGISLGENYAVGTFHPVTLENSTAQMQMEEMLAALESHPEITYLFTKANADTDGRVINRLLEAYSQKHNNLYLVDSLGMNRYLNVVRQAKFVIGNSSSGLIEAPSFHVPTINIGDRQRGRIAGETVIHCKPLREDIVRAIDKAISREFLQTIRKTSNPYGDGHTSEKILAIIKDFLDNDKIDIKKKFYDVAFEV